MERDAGTKPGLKVIVNGQTHSIEPGTSLLELLKKLSIPLEGTAVELSGQIVPKNKYPQTVLDDGQHMEIVRMVGGG